MRVVEEKIYKFSELSETIQTSLIEKELKYRYEYSDCLMFFVDSCQSQAEKKGFNDIELIYSFSHCQGDGLSFSCSDFDLSEFLNSEACKDLKLKDSQKDIFLNYFNLTIEQNNGRYAFCSDSDVEFLLDEYSSFACINLNNIEDLAEKIQEKIRDLYLNLCADFEKQGYAELEHYYCKDNIKACIIENDFEYYSSGEIYEN